MLSKPVPGVSLARRFVDSNPFYLISACCMLAGCLALTNSLSWLSIPRFNLFILIGTLNLYEAALIGLAAFLVLGRGLRRDGMMLVILEAFFLIDVTFLSAEIATQKLPYGMAITVLCFIAAIVKLAVVLRIIGIPRFAPGAVFVLLQIAAILLLPVIFSRNSGGVVSARAFYVAWWIVGLMPVVYELLVKFLRSDGTPVSRSPALTTYMVLSWLSLVAHVGVLHYVYDVAFYGAMGAPLMLALGLVLNRMSTASVSGRLNIMTLQMLLPMAAIFVSANSPQQLTIFSDHAGHFTLTTLRLAMGAAYLEYIYLFFRTYWIYSVLAGAVSVLAVSYGPTTDQIETSGQGFWNTFTIWTWKLTPQTMVGWGILFVVAAFVFLGLGAGVSLRRSVPPPVDPPIGDV